MKTSYRGKGLGRVSLGSPPPCPIPLRVRVLARPPRLPSSRKAILPTSSEMAGQGRPHRHRRGPGLVYRVPMSAPSHGSSFGVLCWPTGHRRNASLSQGPSPTACGLVLGPQPPSRAMEAARKLPHGVCGRSIGLCASLCRGLLVGLQDQAPPCGPHGAFGCP